MLVWCQQHEWAAGWHMQAGERDGFRAKLQHGDARHDSQAAKQKGSEKLPRSSDSFTCVVKRSRVNNTETALRRLLNCIRCDITDAPQVSRDLLLDCIKRLRVRPYQMGLEGQPLSGPQ